MFTYIKLKNFMSLKDITLNLRESQKKNKKFVAIYGENGCGKTNLVTAFDALGRILFSKVAYKTLKDMPKNYKQIKEYLENTELVPEIFYLFQGINGLRMIGEKEPTEMEYGFEIDGCEGYYYIKFEDKIIEERLYYKDNKKRNNHFDIKQNDENIEYKLNTNIFNGKKYRTELEEQINKYWGIHSFLSILYEEMTNKNESFIVENISANLIKVINELSNITVRLDKKNNLSMFDNMWNTFELEEGEIEKDKQNLLDKYEKVLNLFFTQAYADIKSIHYEKNYTGNSVEYKLYFRKIIAGKVREIYYKDESSGTRRILGIFNNLVKAINGKVVVIDEIDNGIHDLLIKNIIMSIKEEITGQLIITTHNTLLLETLPAKELYIITSNYNGEKEVNCITDYDLKIQKNHHNIRDLYLKGVFGGTPIGEYIDFDQIKNVLNSEEVKN